MRIEEKDDGKTAENRLDLVRRLQEQRERLESQQQQERNVKEIEAMSAAELTKELQALAAREKVEQVKETTTGVNADLKTVEQRQDVQNMAGAQEMAGAESARQVDGATRTAEAVDASHHQQERGENWDRFAQAASTDIPESIEEAARQEKEDAETLDRISARDLQNQLQVQGRKIRS